MPSMYDLALSTNRHVRRQTWLQGGQLATMVVFAVDNHRQQQKLNASINDLRADLVEHNGQLLDRIESMAAQTVSEIRAADRRSAHRDYASWRGSNPEGHWFHYQYRPAAEAWIKRVVRISTLWQSMVVEQTYAVIESLSPMDRNCLLTGRYGRPPLVPLARPLVDRRQVKASWLMPFLLALVVFVSSIVIGAVSHSHASDDDFLAAAQIVRVDQESLLPLDPDTGASLTVQRTLELYDGTGRPFVTRSTTGQSAPTFDEIREAISLRRTLDGIIGAIVGALLGLIVAALTLIGTRVLLKRRAVAQAEQVREHTVARDRETYAQALDNYEAACEREYHRIATDVSATLGFDIWNLDILRSWGDRDYLGIAEELKKWLLDCEQVMPSPQDCPTLPHPQINSGWTGTPMAAHANLLATELRTMTVIHVPARV